VAGVPRLGAPLSDPSAGHHGEVLVGDLPARALKLLAEWAALHRGELEADWARAKHGDFERASRFVHR
jgi:hypothetical protein